MAPRRAPLAAGLGTGAALLGAAVAFDAEALYVPGAALLLAAVLSVAWVALGTVGAAVVREIAAKRVVEDEPLDVLIIVRSGAVALPGATLSDDLLSEPMALRPGRRVTRVRIEARFARRGRRTLEPPSIAMRDPLGLAEAHVTAGGDDDVVLVLPRVEPVVTAGAEGDGASARGRRSTASAAEVELDGLRPHRPGAPASRIYWQAAARGAGLLERRLLPEGDARPLVALDAPAGVPDADVDAAVRAVASLAVHLARAGGCAVLLPGDRRPTLLDASMHGWAPLHIRLAVFEAGGTPAAAALGARRGPLLWVSAGRPARAPRTLALAPATSRVLVVPGTLPGRRVAFTVAGCSGYAIAAREAGAAA